MTLGVREMARELGCSAGLISRYKRAGMPLASTDEARTWIAGNVRPDPRTPFPAPRVPASPVAEPPAPLAAYEGEDYRTVRTRREAAEAALAELKLEEQRARLVDKAAVTAEHSKRVVQFREAMLQIPARLSPLLVGLVDQGRIERLIDAELRQALTAFAGGGDGT